MRIAIDARLAAYTRGGIVHYIAWLARALAQLAPDEQLLLLEHVRGRDGLASGPNVRRVALRTPPHHRFEQLALALELLPLRADVLHSPDFIPPFRRTCPAVITVHDLGFLRFPETLDAAARRYYGQTERAVRSAEAIVVPSVATASDLRTRFGVPDEKIAVIPHGVADLFQPAEPAVVERLRARLGLAGPYLLFVGTIEPRKGLDTLLRAFARLAPRAAGANALSLVLAGRRGWLDQPIFDLVERLGLGEQVRFLDALADAELPALYTGAEALVLPSRYEGFGLPVLEAMACGAPVVCSTAGALPEVAGDAALLVEPEDDAGLAATLERLRADAGLRADLRARGLARAAGFRWEESARRHLEVYRRVVGRA